VDLYSIMCVSDRGRALDWFGVFFGRSADEVIGEERADPRRVVQRGRRPPHISNERRRQVRNPAIVGRSNRPATDPVPMVRSRSAVGQRLAPDG
jgi:hypothetical protein